MLGKLVSDFHPRIERFRSRHRGSPARLPDSGNAGITPDAVVCYIGFWLVYGNKNAQAITHLLILGTTYRKPSL